MNYTVLQSCNLQLLLDCYYGLGRGKTIALCAVWDGRFKPPHATNPADNSIKHGRTSHTRHAKLLVLLGQLRTTPDPVAAMRGLLRREEGVEREGKGR